MYPLDFEEFLWAMGDEVTYPLIIQHFEKKEPLGQALHQSIMKSFRQYMLVGGMPQAVEMFAQKNDYELADRIIRNTYKTLLSRGQKGCFVYCEDKALLNYLKERSERAQKKSVVYEIDNSEPYLKVAEPKSEYKSIE